jgi:hypothetical protein
MALIEETSQSPRTLALLIGEVAGVVLAMALLALALH